MFLNKYLPYTNLGVSTTCLSEISLTCECDNKPLNFRSYKLLRIKVLKFLGRRFVVIPDMLCFTNLCALVVIFEDRWLNSLKAFDFDINLFEVIIMFAVNVTVI